MFGVKIEVEVGLQEGVGGSSSVELAKSGIMKVVMCLPCVMVEGRRGEGRLTSWRRGEYLCEAERVR